MSLASRPLLAPLLDLRWNQTMSLGSRLALLVPQAELIIEKAEARSSSSTTDEELKLARSAHRFYLPRLICNLPDPLGHYRQGKATLAPRTLQQGSEVPQSYT